MRAESRRVLDTRRRRVDDGGGGGFTRRGHPRDLCSLYRPISMGSIYIYTHAAATVAAAPEPIWIANSWWCRIPRPPVGLSQPPTVNPTLSGASPLRACCLCASVRVATGTSKFAYTRTWGAYALNRSRVFRSRAFNAPFNFANNPGS